MKTCYFCKGPVAPARVDYMAQAHNQYVMVQRLAVERCVQCGEIYLDVAASREIDKALARAASPDSHLDIPVVVCSEP